MATETRWGDREGRRRDILTAARRRMSENDGYLRLSMRELATEAGVSPGTLYSYFRTKEEIFATLYAEALGEYAATIDLVCEAATTFEQLLVGLISEYRTCYEQFGQYLNLWSLLQDPAAMKESPKELRRSLRDATLQIDGQVTVALHRICDQQGIVLPKGEPVTPLIYAVMNGLCDQYTTERHLMHRREWDDMVAYVARVVSDGLAASVIEPA
jgi:AcrR family transcriptional regulator